MGNWLSSWFGYGDGSCKSVTEGFAFPTWDANYIHVPTKLNAISVDYDDPNAASSYKLEMVFYCQANPVSDDGNEFQSEKAVIFCHGNAMTVNANTIQIFWDLANATQTTFYVLEYPGYGESAEIGTPTAESCVEALEILATRVVSVHGGPQNVLVMGDSVGTGVAARFVHQRQKFGECYAGLLLLSPYKSIMSVVMGDLAETSSSLDFYKTKNIIPEIDVPMTLCHGQFDRVIPKSHSIELANLNDEAVLVLLPCGHNDILTAKELPNIIKNMVKA